MANATRRRWLPRFSLRTLLIAVVLAGSGMALWWRWDEWTLRHSFHLGYWAAFSPDSRSLVVLSEKDVNVVDLRTGRVIASMHKAKRGYFGPCWSGDGRWLALQVPVGCLDAQYMLWDAHHWTSEPVAEWPGPFYLPGDYAKGGYGKSIPLPTRADMLWEDPYAAKSIDGRDARMYSDGVYTGSVDICKETKLLARLIIPSPTDSSDIQTSANGFPNELLTALGFDPAITASTPFNGAPAGPMQPLNLTKLNINLNFKKLFFDDIYVTGTLPLPAGFTPADQQLVFDVGGAIFSFKLDKKGNAQNAKDRLSGLIVRILKPRNVRGQANPAPSKLAFRARLKGSTGGLASYFADEGLLASKPQRGTRRVPVIVLFTQQMFRIDQKEKYWSNTITGHARLIKSPKVAAPRGEAEAEETDF